MFGSKRSSLVRRLWKYRILSQHETASSNETTEEIELKSTAQSMLKRLKEKQLEILLRSVESKGGEITKCVMLPKGEKRFGRRSVSPEMLCCQLWRWPNISDKTELKRLPCCEPAAENPMDVCVNPFHWSILRKPDPPSPSLSRPVLERVAKNTVSGCQIMEDMEESTAIVETETGLTPPPYQQYVTEESTGVQKPHWCHIAYWEHRQRVGRLFPVFHSSISVFQQLPHGNGMCLGILQSPADDESVRKTREKIGFGVMLSRESDGVWLYNQSSNPVFVNSPTIGNPNTLSVYVCKVQSGYSLKIFDYECSKLYEQIRDPQFTHGPVNAKSVRFSFAKGWGPCYTRQYIESCPCWVEVLLNINR